MDSKKFSVGKAVYLIIAAIFFYALILFLSDVDMVISVLSQIQFEKYIAILSLSILTLLIYGWRHKVLLSKLGINLNFKESFLIHTAGIAMIITPGGVGSIVRSYILKKFTGHSISTTTPILIYERWLDVVALTIIIGLLLFWNNFIESQIVFVIALVLSAFIFFVFKNSLGLNLLNKILGSTSISKKFAFNTDEFRDSTKKLTPPKTIISLLSITFLTKFVPMVAVYLVFDLFNLNIDFFNTSQIYFTSQIIGLLSFVPGGMIVTEAGLFGLILKTGNEMSIAAMLVLLIRILTFWFPMFIGFITLKFVLAKR